MALALDRKAFISILFEGQGDIGGTMLPGPQGLWAMPKEMLETIPGYGPDINAKPRGSQEADAEGGYGPGQASRGKVATRNIGAYRDPAVILIDQLKSIYIDGELDVVDTAQWFPESRPQGLHARPQPHRQRRRRSRPVVLRELFLRLRAQLHQLLQQGIEKLFDQQSVETDVAKRKKMVWDIDKKLQEDVARPIIFHARAGTCWQPYVKGVT
jgi:peptide/nickel transport system substrate-binding protein